MLPRKPKRYSLIQKGDLFRRFSRLFFELKACIHAFHIMLGADGLACLRLGCSNEYLLC